jgi:hypothetical protein
MKLSTALSALVLTSLSGLASGFYPVDGWWFNPNESGRGVNIEMQDDTMFVSLFHYAEDGDQSWWITSGQYDASLQRFQSDFIATEDGQCPGCAWVGPDIVSLPDPGVTIDFTSPITATMTWAGGTTSLSRQYFAQFDTDDPRTFLLGEFHFTIGDDGVYVADRLIFDELDEMDGVRFVTGRRSGTDRLALGEFLDGLFIILVEDSDNEFRLYNFDMTKDRMEGVSTTFPVDGEPDGPLAPFIAHRVSSRSLVQTGTGPGLSGSSPAQDTFDTARILESENEKRSGPALPRSSVRALQARIESLKLSLADPLE